MKRLTGAATKFRLLVDGLVEAIKGIARRVKCGLAITTGVSDDEY